MVHTKWPLFPAFCTALEGLKNYSAAMKSVIRKTVYTCTSSVSKKRDQNVFVVISLTKLGRFWLNLVHGSWINLLLNDVNISQLTWISTLPCKTWNAHCTHTTVELLQKGTPEFIPPQLWPLNSTDLNPVDNSTWEMLQEKVYKTRITALELSTTLLKNGFRSDIAQL